MFYRQHAQINPNDKESQTRYYFYLLMLFYKSVWKRMGEKDNKSLYMYTAMFLLFAW